MKYKLIDLYGTRYFYKTWVTDLGYLFSNLRRIYSGEDLSPNEGNAMLGELYAKAKAGEEITLDMCDGHFTTDVTQAIITAYLMGIKFCDTGNPDRQNILNVNARRLLEKPENIVPLPIFGYRDDLKEYVRSLSTDTTYMVTGMSDSVAIALACILTILRPSVSLCVDLIAVKMFKYMSLKVPTKALLDGDDFYVVSDLGVDEAKITDKVYVQELQECVSVEKALEHYVIITKKFGSTVLIEDPNYIPLFNDCVAILTEFQSNCPKRLSEIYGGEEC